MAGLAAYWNSLPNPPVLDDALTLYANQQLLDLTSWSVLAPARELPVAGRPVANLTFAVNYALGGFDLAGYRAANIAVHVLAALVLFGVVRRTLSLPSMPDALRDASAGVALAAALCWVLHPLNSEVVNYLTQRTEALMALFLLVTLYASIRALASEGSTAWRAVAIGACALGMGTKESMAIAPVLVVLFDRVYVFPSLGEAWRARRGLYLGLAACWVIVAGLMATGPRSSTAGFSTDVDVWTYLLNQPALIARYLALAFWPGALVVNYGWPQPVSPVQAGPSAVLVLALLAATVWALWRRPRLGFLGAWFFIALAPTSSIVPIATEVGAERRMYLPLAALVVLVVIAGWTLWRRYRPALAGHGTAAAMASVGLVAMALGAATIARNREYRSELLLAQLTVERYPTPIGRHVLADQLLKAGRRDEAMRELRAALPGAPRAHYTLGVELFNEGRLDDAIAELRRFVETQPTNAYVVEAHGYLAKALAAQQQWESAIREFREILRLSPENSLAAYGLADMLVATGRHGEAISHYQQYLAEVPEDVLALNRLGLAQGSAGRLDEALRTFERAARADPTLPETQLNIAGTLWEQGEYARALPYARRAAELDPSNQSARALLQELQQRSGG